ncbi:MAG TPA: hypothetical protein VJ483_03275 [Holophagaceae bacterium]|nr:hypothetical protein [Holophagaceae bacterium]
MAMDGWVLREPLKVLKVEDQPYLGTALATLGGHEVALHDVPSPAPQPDLRVFLDGELIYDLGMAAPAAPWARLCRDLGYDPEAHWDLDAALILFQQVLPEMAKDWRDHSLPFNDLGVPEGALTLANLQDAWARAVKALRERAKGKAAELVAECFSRLPLRTLTFHDDPRQREDFVGNNLDEPYLGVFVRLGTSQSSRLTLSKATLQGAGGMKWSAWRIGGDWREGVRDFLATREPQVLLQAAGLDVAAPDGFQAAVQDGLGFLVKAIDPLVEAYWEAQPTGVAWHRDPRTRYINHMIVDVRLGDRPALILDDGSEVALPG